MKKRFVPLCLSLLILSLTFLVACFEKIPIPYTQEQMYGKFKIAQQNFLNYTGSLSLTRDTKLNKSSGNVNTVEKFAYDASTKQYASTTTTGGELVDWFLVAKNGDAFYTLDKSYYDEYLVDDEFAYNSNIKGLKEDVNFDILALNKTYNEFTKYFADNTLHAMRTLEMAGSEVEITSNSVNFTQNVDDDTFTLTIVFNYTASSMDANNNKNTLISTSTTNLVFNTSTLLSSYKSGRQQNDTYDTNGSKTSTSYIEHIETDTWSTSYDASVVNSINSTGHTQPTNKIYQYVNVYLDGERVVHDEFEYGTNLDEIIALVTPKEHCTIAETKYVDCNLTKPYVAGSKVKSYGGDEIYLFSAPQTGYATIITLYCKENGFKPTLNDATFEIVNSAQTHTIETNHMVDEYYSYLNYEKVYVNGELVTNNMFNVELGKTYIVRCWHSFEDIDTSVEIYLNGDKIAVETLVNYETLIKDYFDNEGIPYHDAEREIKNGIYCTVKYYSDEALTHELPANAMFKDYSKIYLKLIPNANNAFIFVKTTKADGSIEYKLSYNLTNDYLIRIPNYANVKINGQEFETFKNEHAGQYFYNGTDYGLPCSQGDVFFVELVEPQN